MSEHEDVNLQNNWFVEYDSILGRTIRGPYSKERADQMVEDLLDNGIEIANPRAYSKNSQNIFDKWKQSRLDEHIRPEIQELVKRGNISLQEYKNLRCNSWEWEHLYSALDNEALIYVIEHNLSNCSRGRVPSTTYNEALIDHLTPELLRRFKEKT